jgi:cobalt/nickel transport system permease protein
MIPDWLRRNEPRGTRPDRDAFIDGSIRSSLRLLSRLRRREAVPMRQSVDPRLRLAATVLLVLLLSLSREFLFVAYAGALLLAILSFHRGETILRVLRTSLPIAAFTFLVMLPSALNGTPSILLGVTLKVALSLIALKLLVVNEQWESILGSLFFLPGMFILVLDVTTRYLALLGELSLNMLYAVKLRSVGRNNRKAATLAGIAGTLFLKSRQAAEETYAAMECRCFTGRYPTRRALRLSPADAVPLALSAVTVLIFLSVRAA